MAVTRIKNNQITDATIVASSKLTDYSISAGKIANNLVYGSNLTVSGNLTVNGSTTNIDTNITTIEDPVILLASTASGAPSVDIGFLGQRGSSTNVAFVWDESQGLFVTAFTDTTETETTINITAYASTKVLNSEVTGDLRVTGASNIANMNVAAASTIDFNTSVIGNIGTPVADTDAATKAYVDGELSASGFSITDGVTTEAIIAGDTVEFEGDTNITVLVNQVSGTESNVAVSLNDDVVIGNSLSVTGNVSAGNVDGTRANFTNLVGTLDTAAQTNITSVGTLTSVTASGNITTTGDININARQGLYLHDSDSSHYVAIVPPATVAGNVTFVLPGDAGTSDYVLSTNGAGTLSWIEQSGGGSSAASSFPNSTVTPLPSSEGNFDLSYNYAQTTQETPFESGGTDAFGVSLGEVYSMMDPAGDIPTPTDLGILA